MTKALSLILMVLFSQAAHADLQTSYTVPASQAFPTETTYSVGEIMTVVQGGQLLSLYFALPADLVGAGRPMLSMDFVSQSAEGAISLSGALANASCLTTGQSQLSCKLSYNSQYSSYLSSSESQVAQYLSSKYQSPALEGKMAAAAAFMIDPEGVITFSY